MSFNLPEDDGDPTLIRFGCTPTDQEQMQQIADALVWDMDERDGKTAVIRFALGIAVAWCDRHLPHRRRCAIRARKRL